MSQIYCLQYYDYNLKSHGELNNSLRRLHIDLDKIIAITEPNKDERGFKIICQLRDEPIKIETGFSPFYITKIEEAYGALLAAWISWTEKKNATVSA